MFSFDKMESKGFFTREIEQALLEKKIDLAVHSLKDLPTENPPGLIIAAVPEREDPADRLLVSPGVWHGSGTLNLKETAVVGTSSMRRMAQLKLLRRDLIIEPLRGNVNTRVLKLREGRFDAIVMARPYCASILWWMIFVPLCWTRMSFSRPRPRVPWGFRAGV